MRRITRGRQQPSVAWSIGRLVDWLADWSIGRLIGSFASWLVGRLVGLLAGWLADWLVCKRATYLGGAASWVMKVTAQARPSFVTAKANSAAPAPGALWPGSELAAADPEVPPPPAHALPPSQPARRCVVALKSLGHSALVPTEPRTPRPSRSARLLGSATAGERERERASEREGGRESERRREKGGRGGGGGGEKHTECEGKGGLVHVASHAYLLLVRLDIRPLLRVLCLLLSSA
jgi:hypothetical protein